MDFLKLARERYSCRQLSDKKVEKEKLDKIIEAGILAPTATNAQPYKIWLIESTEAKEKLAKANRYKFGAEVFFVVGAKEDEAWVRKFDNHNFAEVDATIVATHMMLEATELGIGSVWVDGFPNTKTAEVFNLPKSVKPVCLVPMGYAADDVKPSPMHEKYRPIEEMVKTL